MLRAAATLSHGFWSKMVLSLLPESAVAIPRERGPAWEAELIISGMPGEVVPTEAITPVLLTASASPALGMKNIPHPRPPLWSQSQWDGARDVF